MSKFQVIVADPPWKMSDSLSMSAVKRGAQSNYNLLTTDNLCNLPVQKISDPNGCVLALWVVGSMLEDGMKVMKAWGFEQKQIFVWVKTKKEPFTDIIKNLLETIESATKSYGYSKKHWKNYFSLAMNGVHDVLAFGMGRLFRQTHEVCLIGINNTKIYKQLENRSQRSVCFDENQGHSIKPEILQNRLDIMFPKAKKIEIFARRNRLGWTNIGNEVCSGEDISVSIDKLIER